MTGVSRAAGRTVGAPRSCSAGARAPARRSPPKCSPSSLRLDLYRIDLAASSASTSAKPRRTWPGVRRRRAGGASCCSTRRTRCSASAARCKDSHDRYANIEVELPAAAGGNLPRLGDPDHQPEAGPSTPPSCAACASSCSSRSRTKPPARRSGSVPSRPQRRWAASISAS